MASGRPYPNRAEILRFAELKFRSMTKTEWLEAFAHHTPVVEKLDKRGLLTEELKTEFITACRSYERRFGHPFVTHVEGLSADAILSQLKRRSAYDPYDELSVAADQQSRITAERIIRLLDQMSQDAGDGSIAAPTTQADFLKARGRIDSSGAAAKKSA